MRIYFDMDGTIADLYGVENWLNDLRTERTTPYEIANPLCDLERATDLLNELKELDLGNLTPIDALNKLYELQHKIKNRW